jgi:hypothetical protein
MVVLAFALTLIAAMRIGAAQAVRQYYDTTYTHIPTYGYYYARYYYKPSVTYPSYQYHYCIYYPSRPRYIYYYNPLARVYWGRSEIGSKGEKRYSILAEKDCRAELKEIPESAFPTPAAMPFIPGSDDKVAILPPPEQVPKDGKPKGDQ